MVRLNLALAVAAIICAASAAPVIEPPPGNPTYYLRTNSTEEPALDGLYISSYHNGAGLNNATLMKTPGYAIAFLNMTVQEFDLGSQFPYSFKMLGNGNESEPQGVALDDGLWSEGFFFSQAGLTWNNESFGGWLACRESNYTQLWWQILDAPHIENCSDVTLYHEFTTAPPPTRRLGRL